MENKNENGTHQVQRNGNKRPKGNLSCISKELFDQPPQSDYLIVQIFCNILHSTFIFLSKLKLGQMIISILDYYMVKIENTLDFCCPDSFDFADQKIIDRQKSLPVQDRPMAWVFFIPALIFLRILRFCMSVYCIIFGKGEVTAQQMQAKIVAFRRYYRSIRHYAVDKWSEDDKKLIEERKEKILWRIYYRTHELIFMTKPRVEHHHNHDDPKIDAPEVTESPKANGRGKKSLNVSSTSNSDDELDVMQLLDKYDNLDSSADPDYKPNSTASVNSTNDSILSSDGDAQKTESQKDLNEVAQTEEKVENTKADTRNNSFSLTTAQMNDLEQEIMAKILNYFKENRNFPQPSHDNLPEIFYSPIGSPPEKACSDSEVQHKQQQ